MSKTRKIFLAIFSIAILTASWPGYLLYQEYRKAMSDDPLVWEADIAAFERFLVGQRSVMGGHRPEGVLIQEVMKNAAGRDLPLGGVRALEQLVEEVEDGPVLGRARGVAHGLEALELGHEVRDPFLE